jgi:hypothetical protein
MPSDKKIYLKITDKSGFTSALMEASEIVSGVSSVNDLTGAIEIMPKPQVETFTGLANAIGDDTDNNPIGIDKSYEDNKIIVGFDVNKIIDHKTIEYINDTRLIGVAPEVMEKVEKADIIQTTGSANNFLASDGKYHAVGTGNDY